MNNLFKERDGKKIVRYLGTCMFYDLRDEESCDINSDDDSTTSQMMTRGSTWSFRIRTKYMCIQHRDINTDEVCVTPLLTFMNMFEPYTNHVNDFISVLNKSIDKENEGNTENIHTLYSGEPETNEEGLTPGVQE